jgi:acetoin utilization deacetylase AcuC-like enzyme
MAGGYCFINNVAVVTRFLQNYTLEDMNNSKKPYTFDESVINGERSVGTSTDKKRILIIDIDYHQ